MNAAERKRKSREKMKNDATRWKIATENQKKYDLTRRNKDKALRETNETAKIQWREKERLRKMKQREKKKFEGIKKTSLSPLGSYKTINTLKKAVGKIRKVLPESPTKKSAVLMHVLKEMLPTEAIHLSAKTVKRTIVTNETQKLVKHFYEQDDISRPSPNRKDTMSIKDQETGKRAHVAKKHMMMTIAEAYSLFKTEHPDINLGKSKFFALRPLHVRPMSEMPHNVCVCSYHANYAFLLEALNKFLPNLPITTTEFLKLICCDISKETCMTGHCKECFDVTDLIPLKGLDTTLTTFWKQWETVDNRCHLVSVTGTLQDLVEAVSKQTPKFKYHSFAKTAQSNYFKQKVAESTDSELTIQVDFAENFAILQQDEIQSAHWNHNQVTIFTGCAWANEGKEKTSYVVMSNELIHNKYSVWVFMKKMIEDLKSRYPNLKKVHIFSDGCAAQFKNRFTLSTLCYSEEDWGVKAEWSFFASGHGKGAVDGVGATAKRTLWSAIMTKKAVLDTSYDCFQYLEKKATGLQVFFVACGDIEAVQEKLDERWQDMKPIPLIQKHHHFKSHGNKTIKYALTATSQDVKKALLIHDGKLKYSEVYSSSSECDYNIPAAPEINETQNVDTMARCSPAVPKTNETGNVDTMASCSPAVSSKINETKEVSLNDIKNGEFILVRLEVEGKKDKHKLYIAVCQAIDPEEQAIQVTYLKSSGGDGTKFVMDESSEPYHISINQVMKIVKEPAIKMCGNRIYYQFEQAIV